MLKFCFIKFTFTIKYVITAYTSHYFSLKCFIVVIKCKKCNA